MSICCGPSGEGTTANRYYKISFTGQSADAEIRAYTLDGTAIETGTYIGKSEFNTQDNGHTLILPAKSSYRLRLHKKNLEYMETILLEDDFNETRGLNLGDWEINATTTLLSWMAYHASSNNSSKVSVEQVRSKFMNELKNLSIKNAQNLTLTELKNLQLDDVTKYRFNLAIIIVGRASATLNAGTLGQSDWNKIVQSVLALLSKFEGRQQFVADEGLTLRGDNGVEESVVRYLNDLINSGSSKLTGVNQSQIDELLLDVGSKIVDLEEWQKNDMELLYRLGINTMLDPPPNPNIIFNQGTLSIPENGSVTQNFWLDRPPYSPTTLSVSIENQGEITLSESTFRVSVNNWTEVFSLSLSSPEDINAVSETATLYITGQNIDSSPISLTVADDDTIIPQVSPKSLIFDEGRKGDYSVYLNFQPGPDLIVTPSFTGLTSAISVFPSQLTFTAENWQSPQSITVAAAEDDDINDIPLNVTWTPSEGEKSLTNATVLDDDILQWSLSANNFTLTEGSETQLLVRLNAIPNTPVTANFSLTSGENVFSISDTLTTFDASNWNVYQLVSIKMLHDDDAANETMSVTLSGNAVVDEKLTLASIDDDELLIFTSPTSINVLENSTGNVQVKLTAQPQSDLTVNLVSLGGDSDLITNGVNSLVFTTSNWKTEQAFIFSANDDIDVIDGSSQFELTATGLPSVSLPLFEVDDDEPDFIVSAVSANIQENDVYSTQIRLAFQPLNPVFISAQSSDTAEITLTTSSYTFNSSNWNIPQLVELTSVDDVHLADNSANVTFSVTQASDTNFVNVNDRALTLIINNTDLAGFTLSSNAFALAEVGGQGSLSIVLEAQPSSNIILNVSSSSVDHTTVSPSSLTFSPEIWNVAQSVTLSAVNDFIPYDTSAYIQVGVSSLVTDQNYLSLGNAFASVRIINDDIPSFSLSPNALTLNEGQSDSTLSITLDEIPDTLVMFDVSSDNTSEVTVSPSTLSFVSSNWNIPQTVTLTSVEDNHLRSDSAIITASVNTTNTDLVFASMTAQSSNITITNNDVAGFTLSSNQLTIAENAGVGTFDIKLNAEPNSDVVLSITSSDTAEGTVSVSSLTFTTANWNTAQSVSITGVNDNRIGNHSANVTIAVNDALSDNNFDPVANQTLTATFTDDDTPSFSKSATALTFAETGNSSFTVVLGARPDSDVVISVTSSNTAEATVSQSSLTFTSSNWNTAQTITVTGVNDNRIGDDSATVTLSVIDASSDNNFDALADQSISLTLTNDDSASFSISTTALTITETGNGTFTAVLGAQPDADVVISVTSSDTAEATVSQSSLTFTSSNWNTAQTITVTGVNDNRIGDHSATITLSVVDASSDNNFDSLADQTVTMTLTNDDSASFSVSTTALTVAEAANGNFTVVLGAQPETDVVLSVTSSDTAETTVSPSTLTFTSANWNSNQTVVVTGVNDNRIGDHSATITLSVVDASSDNNFDALVDQTVAMTLTDNDAPSFSISSTALTIAETGNGTFTAVLGAQPDSDVVLSVTSSDTAETTVFPATLTFTSANWNTNQTVTVTGVNDNRIGNHSSTITLSVVDASSDNNFDPLADQTVAMTLTDNDTASFSISSTALTIAETGNGTFTAVLGAQPDSDVVLSVTSSDTAETTISPATLTFTSANWNTNQTVTVTGVNDNRVGNHSSTITLSVVDASSDNNFDPLADQTVAMTLTDNDSASFSISSTALTITEIGNSTFTAVLGAQPDSDVVLSVTSSDTAETTVSPATLTFTSANWNTNQTVTVTGVNDNRIGNHTSTITLSVVDGSSDNNFDPLADQTVAMTLTDNDTASFSISTTALTIAESGNTSFTAVLGAQPESDVVLSVSSSNTVEATLSPATLTFTSANWSTNQTVTVTAVDDNILGDHSATATVLVVDGSSDNNFDPLADQTVSLTLTNTDVASLVFSSNSVSLYETMSSNITVQLGVQPTANVSVSISSANTASLTLSPSSMTFTPSNWSTGQTLTFTGVHDDNFANNLVNVTFNTSSSTDATYAALANQTLSVNVLDIEANVVGWWKLDETTGTTAFESSADANNGTMSGGMTFANNSVTGKFGNAVSFDGVNDQIDIPSATALDIGGNQMTLSLWVKLKTLPSAVGGQTDGIFHSISDSYVMFADKSANEIQVKFTDADGTQGVVGVPGADLDTTNWHHIVGVYDGTTGTAQIYLNGVLKDTYTDAVNFTGNVKTGQQAILGRDATNNSAWYDGQLDDVRVYKSALTATQIQALFQQQ